MGGDSAADMLLPPAVRQREPQKPRALRWRRLVGDVLPDRPRRRGWPLADRLPGLRPLHDVAGRADWQLLDCAAGHDDGERVHDSRTPNRRRDCAVFGDDAGGGGAHADDDVEHQRGPGISAGHSQGHQLTGQRDLLDLHELQLQHGARSHGGPKRVELRQDYEAQLSARRLSGQALPRRRERGRSDRTQLGSVGEAWLLDDWKPIRTTTLKNQRILGTNYLEIETNENRKDDLAVRVAVA